MIGLVGSSTLADEEDGASGWTSGGTIADRLDEGSGMSSTLTGFLAAASESISACARVRGSCT